MPSSWLLLTGTGLLPSGAFSVAPVRARGVGSWRSGLAALVTPPAWGKVWLALGFGALQVALRVAQRVLRRNLSGNLPPGGLTVSADPHRQRAPEPTSGVLSESTDLDSLLDAIVGDDEVEAEVAPRQAAEVSVWAGVAPAPVSTREAWPVDPGAPLHLEHSADLDARPLPENSTAIEPFFPSESMFFTVAEPFDGFAPSVANDNLDVQYLGRADSGDAQQLGVGPPLEWDKADLLRTPFPEPARHADLRTYVAAQRPRQDPAAVSLRASAPLPEPLRAVPIPRRRGWRELLTGSDARVLLIVVAILAAVLVALAAISLRASIAAAATSSASPVSVSRPVETARRVETTPPVVAGIQVERRPV